MLWCVDPVDPVLLMLVFRGKRSRQFYWDAYQRAAALLNTLQRFGLGFFLQTYGSFFPFLLKHNNNNAFICCPPNGAAES